MCPRPGARPAHAATRVRPRRPAHRAGHRGHFNPCVARGRQSPTAPDAGSTPVLATREYQRALAFGMRRWVP